MYQFELELTIGESVQLNEYSFTVLDIHGDELTVRIDRQNDLTDLEPGSFCEEIVLTWPAK